MRWRPHRGGALYYADWCDAHPRHPFPVLVAIGADPATLLAAVAPIPDTLSEYEFAGLLRGRRTRTWHSAATGLGAPAGAERSEGHTSELPSLKRNSYAVFFAKQKKHNTRA